MTAGAPARRRILYGRRKGRRLRPGRQALVERLLPALALAVPQEGTLDPRAAFATDIADVWLEVGFGGGEHLAAQALGHPEIGFIGCEPYLDGIAKLLVRVEEEGLTNVRIVADDARVLLPVLAEASIGRMFALFPDPWPKKRHHKRRFVNRATVDACARLLRDGAELRLATDEPGYWRWMLEHLLRHEAFEWLARRPADWRTRPADWPPTRYEAKAVHAGRAPVFLRFRRRARE